jgi:hypothetical protein
LTDETALLFVFGDHDDRATTATRIQVNMAVALRENGREEDGFLMLDIENVPSMLAVKGHALIRRVGRVVFVVLIVVVRILHLLLSYHRLVVVDHHPSIGIHLLRKNSRCR